MNVSLQDLQKTIAALTPEELARFRRWFEEFDARQWDAQFEADAQAGKLDALAEQALAEYQAGKFKEL